MQPLSLPQRAAALRSQPRYREGFAMCRHYLWAYYKVSIQLHFTSCFPTVVPATNTERPTSKSRYNSAVDETISLFFLTSRATPGEAAQDPADKVGSYQVINKGLDGGKPDVLV